MYARALVVSFAMVLALCIIPLSGAAVNDTYSVREYPLPANATDIGAMAMDTNGNVWLIQNEPPVLYKLVRENGTFSSYALDGFKNAGFTGMSVDDAGFVWFADQKGNRFGAYKEAGNTTTTFDFPGPMAPSSILRWGDSVFIGCKEEIGEYDLRFPDEPFLDHFVDHMDSYLRDIHFDRFGNVWAVEYEKNNVSVYWRMYDRTSEFAIPTINAYPTCMSIDSLSRLWFVESGTNKLGMFHTELFNFSEYEMPSIDGRIPHISDVVTAGDTVWLTDVDNDRVLRFYPDEDRFAAVQLAEWSVPTFIEADDNGILWVYEAGSKKLASIEVTDQFGQVTLTPIPTATAQPSATASPQPTTTPGFPALAAIVAMALAMYIIRSRR